MNEQTTIPNNTEIDKALKEFEAKSALPQTQQSSERTSLPQKDVGGVKFEVPSYGAVKYYKETDTSKIVKLVMKISGGAIKEQKQAEYVLLGFVIVAVIFSLFLVFGGGSATQQPPAGELKGMGGTPNSGHIVLSNYQLIGVK